MAETFVIEIKDLMGGAAPNAPPPPPAPYVPPPRPAYTPPQPAAPVAPAPRPTATPIPGAQPPVGVPSPGQAAPPPSPPATVLMPPPIPTGPAPAPYVPPVPPPQQAAQWPQMGGPKLTYVPPVPQPNLTYVPPLPPAPPPAQGPDPTKRDDGADRSMMLSLLQGALANLSSMATAAGGLNAGGVMQGAAGLARGAGAGVGYAVGGPAGGVIGAGVADIATALPMAVKSLNDALLQTAEKLSAYNGNLAQATAEAEVAQILGDIKRGQALGNELSALTEANSKLSQASQDAMATMAKAAAPYMTAVVKEFEKFIKLGIRYMEWMGYKLDAEKDEDDPLGAMDSAKIIEQFFGGRPGIPGQPVPPGGPRNPLGV